MSTPLNLSWLRPRLRRTPARHVSWRQRLAHQHSCGNARRHTHTHKYIYIYMCIYTHTHTHKHTQRHARAHTHTQTLFKRFFHRELIVRSANSSTQRHLARRTRVFAACCLRISAGGAWLQFTAGLQETRPARLALVLLFLVELGVSFSPGPRLVVVDPFKSLPSLRR